MCLCVSVTLAHAHTVSSDGAWGPIYLHAVEEEQRIGGRDKTKREVERKRKQRGNYGENPEERTSFSRVPKDRQDQFTVEMTQCVCMCAFCLPGSGVISRNATFIRAQLFLLSKLKSILKLKL